MGAMNGVDKLVLRSSNDLCSAEFDLLIQGDQVVVIVAVVVVIQSCCRTIIDMQWQPKRTKNSTRFETVRVGIRTLEGANTEMMVLKDVRTMGITYAIKYVPSGSLTYLS